MACFGLVSCLCVVFACLSMFCVIFIECFVSFFRFWSAFLKLELLYALTVLSIVILINSVMLLINNRLLTCYVSCA